MLFNLTYKNFCDKIKKYFYVYEKEKKIYDHNHLIWINLIKSLYYMYYNFFRFKNWQEFFDFQRKYNDYEDVIELCEQYEYLYNKLIKIDEIIRKQEQFILILTINNNKNCLPNIVNKLHNLYLLN